MESGNKKELIKIFKIFTNEHRLAILSFLKSNGEKSVGNIADNINSSFGVTSKHLMFLFKKGVLKRRYDGNFVLYEIVPDLPKSTTLIISHLL